ncbi:tetratricopeptide repeat protein [Rhabdothermincola sediminis]|uniref:tetratricopeptide repeat protein n=1 Tax=Rhabdothermincola sediminis TaxID=2751370 RepID=UPI001AA079D2|nr:tetratricopeptide repeat protein [Rhabdothermincola sediminis]
MAIDVTDASFENDVVRRSEQVPVVVDLWAPWCGPCRTLGPILERVIDETGGAVMLAKVNVDENPQVSAAFRVQGIPAVYALKGGKVVDGFIGAQGEAAIREFVSRLLPTPEESEIDRLVAAGDESSLRAALERDPDHAGAILALAELLIGDGRSEEALELLARLPESAETRHLAALARTGATGGAIDDIDAKLEELLDRVKEDDAARQEYVDLLEVLGPDDPRTARYRKALTARLY